METNFGTILPQHLIHCIAQHLPLQSRTALRSTARCIGDFPADHLLRGLEVPLSVLDLSSNAGQSSRLRSMACLAQLKVVPSPRPPGSVAVAAAAAKPDDEASAASAAAALEPLHAEQAHLLVSLHVAAMPSLRSLTLDGVSLNCVVAAVSQLPLACPALTKLALLGNVSSLDQGLSAASEAAIADEWHPVWAALAAAPTLQTLVVEQVAACWDGLADLTQLHSLTLGGVMRGSWHARVSHCSFNVSPLTGLTRLEVSTASRHGQGELLGLPDLAGLQSLRLSSTALHLYVHEQLARDVSSLTALTALTLTEIEVDAEVVEQLLAALLPLRQLAVLELHGWPLPPAAVAALQGLTSLTCFGLQISDAGTTALAFCRPSLRHLCFDILMAEGRLGPAAAQPLGSTFPNLESMTLSDVSMTMSDGGVWDAACVAWLSSLWPKGGPPMAHLRSLTLLTAWPDGVLSALLTACPVLEHMHLRCTPEGDLLPALEGPGLGVSSQALRRLQMLQVDRVACEEHLQRLLTACPSLTQLGIGGGHSGGCGGRRGCCSGDCGGGHGCWCGGSSGGDSVSDTGLATLLQVLPSLRDLCLTECATVSRAGMLALAGQRSVQRIRVVGCRRVVASDALEVVQTVGRPWLDLEIED